MFGKKAREIKELEALLVKAFDEDVRMCRKVDTLEAFSLKCLDAGRFGKGVEEALREELEAILND